MPASSCRRIVSALAGLGLLAMSDPGLATPRAPARDPTGWVTPSDYPVESIDAREQGRVRAMLTIMPDGRVSACRITGPSGFSRLGDATCALLVRRARFEAASGPSELSLTIEWVHPIWPTKPPEDLGGARLIRGITNDDYPSAAVSSNQQGWVGARFDIDVEGRGRSCEVFRSSGYHLLDRATCEALEKRVRFEPARGADGQPVPVTGVCTSTIFRLPGKAYKAPRTPLPSTVEWCPPPRQGAR